MAKTLYRGTDWQTGTPPKFKDRKVYYTYATSAEEANIKICLHLSPNGCGHTDANIRKSTMKRNPKTLINFIK